MQIPMRKAELARLQKQTDQHVTLEKIERMKEELVRLAKERPALVAEVTRTQEMGDLSENAGYQDAKYRLRRLDGRVLSLKDRIAHAIPIEEGPDASGRIRIGSTVTIESD
jgi:transcription elongation factor GreA